MNLSRNFSLAELIASDVALRKGIANVPSADVVTNLFTLARGLERVRTLLGYAMHSLSGYRCSALNVAVGGSDRSDHMLGLADDFLCPGFGSAKQVAQQIAEHAEIIQFEQLIFEGTWVHISFPPPGKLARKQVLTAHFEPGKKTRYSTGIDA